MEKAILLTQCLQNDFVRPIEKYDELPNRLHVGYSESLRLLGEQVERGPVSSVMEWAYQQPADQLEIIHIRDWHEAGDPAQRDHLAMFGEHCLADTPGADFVFESLRKKHTRPDHVVNATGLNDFQGTNLARLLEAGGTGAPVKVGLMGVWTEAKIYFLAYELKTRYPHFQLALCSALCASSSRQMHFISLDQMRNILGLQVFSSVGDFTSFLTGSLPDLQPHLSSRLEDSKLQFQQAHNLQAVDKQLILYLFRDCREVMLKGLDGGFSGNVVLRARARDVHGHAQVPTVVKIGPRSLIAKERISFEQIQEVLGNNAPSIVDFCEIGERGAIKYRYAAMLEGEVHCFQDLYEAGLDGEPLELLLDRIFLHQLGRLYEAESLEKVNLLDYYDFQAKYAPHVERSVRAILSPDDPQAANLDSEVVPGFRARELPGFYAGEVQDIRNHADRLHYLSFVHGDLNGKNILQDGQGNVWIIDFFGAHRGHVLRDLVKLENDLLFIFTKITSQSELESACALTDRLLEQADLAAPPDPAEASQFALPHLQRAWKTVCHLRAYYPALVKLDRSPHQLHIAQLRYAVHTLSFDECNHWQKRWALHLAARCVQALRATHSGSQRLRIDFLPPARPGEGRLGLTILPGRRDRSRSLEADLAEIKRQGVSRVACLITENEFERYGVPGLKAAYAQAGLQTRYEPILDQGVPALSQLLPTLDWLEAELSAGRDVLVHCVGGLGRSGLVAAAYLIQKTGMTAKDALAQVRQYRSPRAVETRLQEEFLEQLEADLPKKS